MTSGPTAPRNRRAARTRGGSPQRAREGGKLGGLPRRGRSSRPARRCSKNRLRHCETTSRPQRNRAAIWSLRRPSAAISTICARVTCQYGNVYDRANDSNTPRSSSVNSIRYGLCLGISVPSRDDRMPRTLWPRSDANTSPYLRREALSLAPLARPIKAIRRCPQAGQLRRTIGTVPIPADIDHLMARSLAAGMIEQQRSHRGRQAAESARRCSRRRGSELDLTTVGRFGVAVSRKQRSAVSAGARSTRHSGFRSERGSRA